jgi:hypothetical protein
LHQTRNVLRCKRGNQSRKRSNNHLSSQITEQKMIMTYCMFLFMQIELYW